MHALPTDPSIDDLGTVSAEQARALIATSDTLRSRREKSNRKRVGRLFKDPKAIEVTITLTDEVMRVHSTREAIKIFAGATRKASTKGFIKSPIPFAVLIEISDFGFTMTFCPVVT